MGRQSGWLAQGANEDEAQAQRGLTADTSWVVCALWRYGSPVRREDDGQIGGFGELRKLTFGSGGWTMQITAVARSQEQPARVRGTGHRLTLDQEREMSDSSMRANAVAQGVRTRRCAILTAAIDCGDG